MGKLNEMFNKAEARHVEKIEGITELLERSIHEEDLSCDPVVENLLLSMNVDGLLSSTNELIGDMLFGYKNYRDSLYYYDKSLFHYPSNSVVLFKKAKIFMMLGYMKSAYKLLTQAQVICEKRLNGYEEGGIIDDFVKEIEVVDLSGYEEEFSLINDEVFNLDVVNIEQELDRIYSLKGFILSELGEHDLAIDYHDKSVESQEQTEEVDAFTLYGRAYSLIQKGDEFKALVDLQDILKQEEDPYLI